MPQADGLFSVGEKGISREGGYRPGGEDRRRAWKGRNERRKDGQGRCCKGPGTHVGEEEQHPGEECDNLASQPQVVQSGAVRVGGLRGRWHTIPHPAPPTLAPDPDVPPRPPKPLDPVDPLPSLSSPTQVQGEGALPSWALSSFSHRDPQRRTQPCPSCAPAPAGLPATHGAFQWLVVGGEGKDHHGAEIGDHVDVEGHSAKLTPLVPQQLVDGFHGQHLVAVLWETGQAGATWGPGRPTLTLPSPPSAPRALSPP